MESPEVGKTLDRLQGVGETVMDVAAGYPLAKGVHSVSKAVAKVPSSVADFATEKLAPSSWEPAGTPTKKTVAKTDKAQQRIDRIQEKAPQVVENRKINAIDDLVPVDRTYTDPAKATAMRDKAANQGMDNLEQLAAEGVLHEFDAKGNVVMQADGVTPKPYEVGKGGVSAAVQPVLQGLKEIWGEVEKALTRHGKNNTLIPSEGVKGLEQFNGRSVSATELQRVISENNEVLHGTKKSQLGIEDTRARNKLKRENAELNNLLDESVGQLLEGMGMKDLHAEWGGMRTLADGIINGAERKLQKVFSPDIGDVPAQGGLSYKAANIAKNTVKKYFQNPDRAFANLIRARRAQGNVVRNRVLTDTPPPQELSQPTGLGTGEMSGDLGQFVGKTTLPTEANLGLEGQSVTPGKLVSQVNTGVTPPAKSLLAETASLTGELKQRVRSAGGGKKGVADVAKQLGMPAAVLATWLLADDEKQKELAMLPMFAGLGMLKVIKHPQQALGKTLEISVNPSKAEIYKYLRETKKAQEMSGWTQHPYSNGNALRYIIDADKGDIYFAPADMVTHDMIAEANGVKDIGYRGMVKSGNTLDMMFQSPWFKDATKGKFGGDGR
jgi:hypothetical protein